MDLTNIDKKDQVEPETKTKHHLDHKPRRFFSFVFGVISLVLITLLIITVWLNRTLINQDNYIKAMSSVVSQPAVQNFISTKVANQILDHNQASQIVTKLLPSSIYAGHTNSYIEGLLNPIVYDSVSKVVSSSQFLFLWVNTNRAVHQTLISQLNGQTSQIKLGFHSAITGVISQLKSTQLSPVVSQINISKSIGDVSLNKASTSRLRHFYKLFQVGTLGLILATAVSVLLTVFIAPHWLLPIKRLLLGLIIICVILFGVIEFIPGLAINMSDTTQRNAILAIVSTLLRSLKISLIVVAVLALLCLLWPIVYARFNKNKSLKNVN
ncbi:MAG TPA: hypothetical protein VMR76_00275 [Candidatus Saccharimonadia bacterium]|nr:hypothetical protein [Candidatus Saccharimonadia bacterium]